MPFLLVQQNIDGSVQDPGPQATHEVSIFASGAWRKVISSLQVCLFFDINDSIPI